MWRPSSSTCFFVSERNLFSPNFYNGDSSTKIDCFSEELKKMLFYARTCLSFFETQRTKFFRNGHLNHIHSLSDRQKSTTLEHNFSPKNQQAKFLQRRFIVPMDRTLQRAKKKCNFRSDLSVIFTGRTAKITPWPPLRGPVLATTCGRRTSSSPVVHLSPPSPRSWAELCEELKHEQISVRLSCKIDGNEGKNHTMTIAAVWSFGQEEASSLPLVHLSLPPSSSYASRRCSVSFLYRFFSVLSTPRCRL